MVRARSERLESRGGGGRRFGASYVVRSFAAVWLLALCLPGTAWTQDEAAGEGAGLQVSTARWTELAEELAGAVAPGYEVLTLSEGYVLRPKDSDLPLVELSPGRVLVEGTALSRRRLESFLGREGADLAWDLARRLGDPDAWASLPDSASTQSSEGTESPVDEAATEEGSGAAQGSTTARTRDAGAGDGGTGDADTGDADSGEVGEREASEAVADIPEDSASQEAKAEERRSASGREWESPRRSTQRIGSLFGVGGRRVEEDERARDVVAFGGRVVVNGEVDDSVVVVGGSAWVDGEVGGDVVAVGGTVHLGRSALVRGDVVSVGGGVERERGARVWGDIQEVSLWSGSGWAHRWSDGWDGGWDDDWRDSGGRGWSLFGKVLRTVLLAGLAVLIGLLFTGPLSRVEGVVRSDPWLAGLVGVVSQVLLVVAAVIVSVVLTITLIGIPLLLALWLAVPLALGAFLLLGYTAVATALGRKLAALLGLGQAGGLRSDSTALDAHSPVPNAQPLATALGVLLIQVWTLLGALLAMTWGPLVFLGWILLLSGFLIKYVAWSVGLGSVVMRFLTRTE